jgi:hypothetical protein
VNAKIEIRATSLSLETIAMPPVESHRCGLRLVEA